MELHRVLINQRIAYKINISYTNLLMEYPQSTWLNSNQQKDYINYRETLFCLRFKEISMFYLLTLVFYFLTLVFYFLTLVFYCTTLRSYHRSLGDLYLQKIGSISNLCDRLISIDSCLSSKLVKIASQWVYTEQIIVHKVFVHILVIRNKVFWSLK